MFSTSAGIVRRLPILLPQKRNPRPGISREKRKRGHLPGKQSRPANRRLARNGALLIHK